MLALFMLFYVGGDIIRILVSDALAQEASSIRQDCTSTEEKENV